MSTIDKKAISEALKEAMAREDLNTRAVAKLLNLNPCYISMCLNPNSWDAMGKAPWVRLEEWQVTRLKISEFVIPEGEEIWQPKEKPVKTEVKIDGKKLKATFSKSDEHIARAAADPHPLDPAPEAMIKLSNHKEQVEKLRGEISSLIEQNERLKNQIYMPATAAPIATQKLSLDIEINLIINGQKVRL